VTDDPGAATTPRREGLVEKVDGLADVMGEALVALTDEVRALAARVDELQRTVDAAVARATGSAATANGGNDDEDALDDEREWLGRLAWGAMVIAVLALVVAFSRTL
jgi:hypothetical protein